MGTTAHEHECGICHAVCKHIAANCPLPKIVKCATCAELVPATRWAGAEQKKKYKGHHPASREAKAMRRKKSEVAL